MPTLAPGIALRSGRLAATIIDGDVRGVSAGGREVLRRLSYPVRDRDWGTIGTQTTAEQIRPDRYRRLFRATDGAFEGTFEADLSATGLDAVVEFRLRRALPVNRIGFTLLHPLDGVVGGDLTVRHPDGSSDRTTFPVLIAPGQPARDIVGLAHPIGGGTVTITFEGEVFEMEDQRNWSDASFKTYCRPLALPRPIDLEPGAVVRQRITLSVDGVAASDPAETRTQPSRARLPVTGLAFDPALCSTPALTPFCGLPILARVSGRTGEAVLATLAGCDSLALEFVFDDPDDLAALTARCLAAGLAPRRVVGLPTAYLSSYQPEGPWPDGVSPEAAVGLLRAAFPGVAVGGGSLTNFTELNRCRPDPAVIDFVTFGNTAIVHAADDLSVLETLEALPSIFASAAAIAGGRPLHLGLLSIGMRSNPYGTGVVPNPLRDRIPMAMDDPRQDTGFAAAYAVAVLAEAARAGVGSLALAMVDGPLGALGRPVGDVIRAAARWSAQPATVTVERGLVLVETDDGGLAANLTAETITDGRIGSGPLAPLSAASWDSRP